MNLSSRIFLRLIAAVVFFLTWVNSFSQSHKIFFCGEAIPVSRDIVASKLMNVIRRQIPNVNMPSLHKRALAYFPFVTNYFTNYGIPEDFKYLPIIESSFTLERTKGGARGIWQFMPWDGKEYGLTITDKIDERDDIEKSTKAACMELVDYYNMIQKKYHISSWILTAAAYNFGIGNIFKTIDKQGTDYFSMKLNEETANYVYKIVAVKELFEYPELYMKDFGYNIFSSITIAQQVPPVTVDTTVFAKLSLPVETKEPEKAPKSQIIGGYIKGKYKNFRDGDLITIQLDEDLILKGGFTRKGTTIRSVGWIIDNRIYVDLGYGHDVLLSDANGLRGIATNHLKNNEPVLLINKVYDDQADGKL